MVDRADSNAHGTLAYWPFDEGEGSSAEEVVSGRLDPIEHVFADARFKPDSDPRWIDGVVGTGLLFDGYSTRLEHDRRLLDDDVTALAVEAWVAPRAFEGGASERLSAIVSNHSVDDDRGFEFGLDGHGRCSFQVGLGDSWESVRTEDPLPKYAWSHAVGVFDGDNGALRIHIDGERAARAQVPDGSAVAPADVPVRIGKNNQTERVDDVFMLNTFAGAIDELWIRDRALAAVDVEERYKSACDDEPPSLKYEKIVFDPSRYRGDPHRPQYHPIPLGHWMNEPHGPIYHDSRYHLFYQYNPSGPYWGNIHWGHWVSDDLVHWRHVDPALAPEADGIAPDGIWSGGSTHDSDGDPVLFFTAGDLSRTPDQRVAMAHPVDPDDPDLRSWDQSDDVVIERPHSIGLRDNDFRDPFVWRENDAWYCLIGAGFEDGGTALVYESESLEEWQFRGSLHRSDHDERPELGLVWELPVLLPVGEDETGVEKHIFIVSPLEGGAEVEVYYWLGEWDPDDCRFDPDHEEPRLIDHGDFHFTGPHGMVDPETGRSLLFTIAQDDRRPQDHYNAGWAHNGGLPVHLHLRGDGRLGVEPIDELRLLRSERLASVRETTVPEANDELADVRSSTAEIRATIASGDAEKYGLKVRANPDGTEETLLYYDEQTERIVVHREHSTRDPEMRTAISERSSLVHRSEVDLDGDDLDLHVYLDGSMLEVYVNGLKSVTTRLYPEDERSTGIEAWTDGDTIVKRLDVWELDGAYQ